MIVLICLALYPFFSSVDIIRNFFQRLDPTNWQMFNDLAIIIIFVTIFFVGFCIGWLVYGVYILMKRTLDRRK